MKLMVVSHELVRAEVVLEECEFRPNHCLTLVHVFEGFAVATLWVYKEGGVRLSDPMTDLRCLLLRCEHGSANLKL